MHTVLSCSAKIGLCARTPSFLGKADISLKMPASFKTGGLETKWGLHNCSAF